MSFSSENCTPSTASIGSRSALIIPIFSFINNLFNLYDLKQVSDIDFIGLEKDVYDRAVDYKNDSIYYLEKEDMRTAFGCIEYSHGLLDALRMIHEII